jgi:hypothetical protein
MPKQLYMFVGVNNFGEKILHKERMTEDEMKFKHKSLSKFHREQYLVIVYIVTEVDVI